MESAIWESMSPSFVVARLSALNRTFNPVLQLQASIV